MIPILDVSGYLAGGNAELPRLGAELRHAFENVGFYYLRGHGVPRALIDATFAQCERFHAQPMEKKLALKINEHNIGERTADIDSGPTTVHRVDHPADDGPDDD